MSEVWFLILFVILCLVVWHGMSIAWSMLILMMFVYKILALVGAIAIGYIIWKLLFKRKY